MQCDTTHDKKMFCILASGCANTATPIRNEFSAGAYFSDFTTRTKKPLRQPLVQYTKAVICIAYRRMTLLPSLGFNSANKNNGVFCQRNTITWPRTRTNIDWCFLLGLLTRRKAPKKYAFSQWEKKPRQTKTYHFKCTPWWTFISLYLSADRRANASKCPIL